MKNIHHTQFFAVEIYILVKGPSVSTDDFIPNKLCGETSVGLVTSHCVGNKNEYVCNFVGFGTTLFDLIN